MMFSEKWCPLFGIMLYAGGVPGGGFSSMGFDAGAAARHLIDEHARRARFANLPAALAPRTLEEAYAAQAALEELLAPSLGTPGGAKIAVTTKVMQELMGIDQPCCGMIFSKRILTSPARLAFSDFISLKLECEIALRLGRDLAAGTGHTKESVAGVVGHVLPAFELVEDRNAEYRKVDVKSLVADNCWNAGVVLGAGIPFAAGQSLTGLQGVLDIDGKRDAEGLSEDPLEVLAWTANLLGQRGRSLKAGQVVMTGSLIATFPAVAGKTFRFDIEGFGETVLEVE